jgi:hypothetical protein
VNTPHITPQAALQSLSKEENTFQINLDALRAYDPVLANSVSCFNLKTHWDICPTEDGPKTVKKILGENRFHFVHSSVNPTKEAEKWADLVQCTSKMLVVLGIGLGYHLLALKEVSPPDTLIIIEADLELFSLAVKLVDLTPIIRDLKVHLLIGKKASEVKDFLNNFHKSSISYREFLPSTSLHPEYYQSIKEILETCMFRYRLLENPELSQELVRLLEETKG